jgi:hypothetical protein
MGANLKSVIPQSIQSSSEAIPLPELYLPFSSIASLNEIQRLSQFLPVIVLVPKIPSARKPHLAFAASAALPSAGPQKSSSSSASTQPKPSLKQPLPSHSGNRAKSGSVLSLPENAIHLSKPRSTRGATRWTGGSIPSLKAAHWPTLTTEP